MSERRPEGVEGYSLDTGIFPTDAFTFTKPTATSPMVVLSSGWKMSLPGISLSNCSVSITSFGNITSASLVLLVTPKG